MRTDAAGSVNFNIAAAGGSEGFWGFFTDGAPVTLGVGDHLTVSSRFSVQNIGANLGADLRFGVFDSKGTRTTANTTGGINSPTFADDPGYATRLAGTAASSTPPFTVHRRTSPSATDPLANVISTTVAEYTALTVTGGSARAPLANGVPYTFTFTVERISATETKVTVSMTDGGSFNLNSTATETNQTPATTFNWFGFRALLAQGAIALLLIALGAWTRDGFGAIVEYTAPVSGSSFYWSVSRFSFCGARSRMLSAPSEFRFTRQQK